MKKIIVVSVVVGLVVCAFLVNKFSQSKNVKTESGKIEVKNPKDEKMNRKITKIIYVAGVVIDNKELLPLVNNKYPNIFCHHMTIQFNNGDLNSIPDFIGKEFDFIASNIFEDDKAIAVTGEPDSEEIFEYMENINQKPHITICTAKDIKPVYSNTLIASDAKRKPSNIKVKMRVGAFCSFDDGTTDWVYKK